MSPPTAPELPKSPTGIRLPDLENELIAALTLIKDADFKSIFTLTPVELVAAGGGPLLWK